MDLPGQSATMQSTTLEQIKAELKQWERNFRTQHSRPPSKADVQACASIQQLYREYARLKKKQGNENVATEDKIHLKADPRVLVKEVVTNSEVAPLERNRLFPPQRASPSDDSSGSHISSTPPKSAAIKRQLQFAEAPSSDIRRPLQVLSPNSCNTNRAQQNSNSVPSSSKSESGSNVKRKAASNTASAVPQKAHPQPAAAAPRRKEFLPACPLALEGGLVIKLQRHGSHLNDRQSSISDDALPAGFFSRSRRPSSLFRKDVEPCSIISTEGEIIRDDDNADLDPVVTAAPTCEKLVKNQGTSGDTAQRAGNVLDQPPCVDVAYGTQISSPSSDVGIGHVANLQSDGPTNSTAQKENETSKTASDLGDLSVEKRDLQKITVVGLKQMLLKHGLPLTGNKSTLIHRLEEVLLTEKQVGRPSKGEDVDTLFHEHGQTRDGTTCATRSKQLKRKSEDYGHELVREDISNTGDGKSLKLSGRYSLRSSRELPSAEQHEFDNGKVNAPSPERSSAGEGLKVSSVVKVSTKRVKISEPVVENSNPERPSAGEGLKVSSVVKASTKRVRKISEPVVENSWGNPTMLRKGARRIQKGKSQVPHKSRQRPCLRPGERDNFVRLNINGKGGKGRRFVNGTRTKRPGAYGRRGAHGAKFRRKGRKDAANGGLDHEGNEVHLDGHCEPTKNRADHKAKSFWANDGWLETTSPEGLVDNSNRTTGAFSVELKEAIENAQKSPSDKNLAELLHVVFGFKTFRTGQLEAIQRILSLQSTMVTLPTGAGKSLCYQLPAHLLPGITLVISPLIALMTDQLGHLPPSLPGALISSAQTQQESSSTISRLRAGQVKVLFISPERLFSESFLCILGELPRISLAVIDEAHCLSEWSHNFRPSYFRLGKVLHQRMKVSCVLAMTATATKKAEQSILKSLSIPAAGVVQAFHVRQNLSLSVSRETNRRVASFFQKHATLSASRGRRSPRNSCLYYGCERLQSLLSLLQSSPYAKAKSIIIYCTFQVETDNISAFLERNGIQAKSYHAKKTSQERNRIYDLFCRNKLRVVVATVAFGMGLDKSDVRAIVHYNMPRSLEHYVQETGRAGRDGNPAYCHLFLDDGDFLKLRSLAYSDGVDEYSVNKFLCRIFNGSSASTRPGNLVSIIIDTASRELDMKEEAMETILSLLEVGEVEYVKVLSKLNATCTLSFHQSNPALLAGRNTFVAAIMKGSKEKQGRFVFDLPSIATQLQWSLFQVQSELRRLQAAGEVTYEVGDSALCFSVLQIPEDICLLTSKITKRLAEVEQCQVRKLDAMYLAASAAVRNIDWTEPPQESDTSISSRQGSLQSCIKSYFEGEEGLPVSNSAPTVIQSDRSFVRADIKVFLKSARNPLMTGRAVARVFHGLWSPAFPYAEWSRNHFWGQHARVDFEIIKEAAAAEILMQHTTSRADFQL